MEPLLAGLRERDARFSKPPSSTADSSHHACISDLSRKIDELEARKLELIKRRQIFRASGVCSGVKLDVDGIQRKTIALYQEGETREADVRSLTAEVDDLSWQRNDKENAIADFEAQRNRIDANVVELANSQNKINERIRAICEEIGAVDEQVNRFKKECEMFETQVQERRQTLEEGRRNVAKGERRAVVKLMNTLSRTKDMHTGAISGVTFGDNYESIITVGDDKRLYQWSLPSLAEITSCTLNGAPNAVRVHTESRLVVLPCDDAVVRIVNLETGRVVVENKSHTASCTDAFWMSKNQLLSASTDRTVKLFDVNRNTVVSTLGAMSAVYSLCETASPDVYVAACFKGLRLLDTRTKKVERKIEPVHSRQITCVIPSTSRETLYTIGLDNCVRETSISQGTQVRPELKHDGLIVKHPLTRIGIDPMGGFLAAGSENGTVTLFPLQRSDEPIVLSAHNAPVTNVAFAGNMLVTADRAHKMCFWT